MNGETESNETLDMTRGRLKGNDLTRFAKAIDKIKEGTDVLQDLFGSRYEKTKDLLAAFHDFDVIFWDAMEKDRESMG